MPHFTLTIAGVDYTASDRAAAGIHMGALELYLDGSGYDMLTFTEVGGAPVPLFHNAQSAILTRVNDDTSTDRVFTGEIVQTAWGPTPKGWGKAFTCKGLRYIGDRVPATATDGTGQIVLNREPQDPYYTPSLAGLSVGQIIEYVLTVPFTATLLDSMGIGNYVSLSPPTLPTATLDDLALMTIVPPRPVTFLGESLINLIDQFIQQWQYTFIQELTPGGLLRYKDTTDVGVSATFVPRTLTLPGSTGIGDTGVQWPSITASTENCSTSCILRGGPETEAAWITLNDGTLEEGWSGGEEAAWTLYDFTQPNDAYDEGNISAMTSTTATVDSDNALTTFATNFWPGREAVIFMINTAAAGILQQENRIVTANTSMSSGGSATATWDSSWPVTQTNYTRYRLVGTSGGNNEVGRLYYPVDAATGDSGLNSYIGARMVVRSPYLIRVANNDKTYAETYASTATICWSSSGSPPYVELPAIVEPVPALGAYRFTTPTQNAFTAVSVLQLRYPASYAEGKPGEIRVLAMYSRGAHEAQVPSSSFEGTAFTVDGLEVTKYLDYPDWLWAQDTTSFTALAQQYLNSVKDIVWEGSGLIYGFPSFDVLTFNTAINYAVDGDSSPWDAMNAPIRSVRIEWVNGGEAIWFTHLTFSTRRRPFSADTLYIHPQFAPGSPLTTLTKELADSFGVKTATGLPPTELASQKEFIGATGKTTAGTEGHAAGEGGSGQEGWNVARIGATGAGITSPLMGASGGVNAMQDLANKTAGNIAGLTQGGASQIGGLAGGLNAQAVGMGGIAGQAVGMTPAIAAENWGMAPFDPGMMGAVMPAGFEPREPRAKARPTPNIGGARVNAPQTTDAKAQWRESMQSMGGDMNLGPGGERQNAPRSVANQQSWGRSLADMGSEHIPTGHIGALESNALPGRVQPQAMNVPAPKAKPFVGPRRPPTKFVGPPSPPKPRTVVQGLVQPGEQAPDPMRDPRGQAFGGNDASDAGGG